MPSTTTAFYMYEFTPLTKIKSAEVNNNFDNFCGHLCPVDPAVNFALASSGVYDLGADTNYWAHVYAQSSRFAQVSSMSTPAAGFNDIYFKTDGMPYSKNSAGTESPLGGAFKIVNSRASPGTITAAGGVPFDIATNGLRQYMFVTGDTTLGTDITADPQIAAGTLGAELILCVPNTSTRYAITLDHGTGLDQNSSFLMNAGGLIRYFHDGTEWLEQYRKDM